MDDLVSTGWLAENLAQADVVPVDASWFMPASGRSGHAEFLASHITGARFLDIDAVSSIARPNASAVRWRRLASIVPTGS